MDWIDGKETILKYIKKYRYLLIMVLTGVLLLLNPADKEMQQETIQIETEKAADLEDKLEQILCRISGAGDVEVLLTQKAGEQILYQMDEDLSADDTRRDTVIVTNAAREEEGLVKQKYPPVYLGAVVVCQGADDPSVKLAIVDAVKSATGLTSDCISVLKMK